MTTSTFLRRSVLILPAHNDRFVAKAPGCGADAVCLDLEDSVPPHRKAEARAALQHAVPVAGRGGADVLVRVNSEWHLLFDDLDAAVIPGVATLSIPKVEAPEDVYAIDKLIEERERRRGMPVGSVRLGISIETAKGLMRDMEITRASLRICSVSCGIEDLATDLEVELTDDAWELFYPKARLVIVARACGVQPLGLVGRVSDYRDLESFRRTAKRSRGLGYAGASCIHPDQVAILNEEFSPSVAEIEKAKKIVALGEQANQLGKGAFDVDGQMADIPTIERARRLLRRAQLIEKKAAGSAAA